MVMTETTTKSMVWVFQEGKNDYSPAEEFGKVNFITRTELVAYADNAKNAQVYKDIRDFNSKYVAGLDFIIPTGNPIGISLLGMSLSKCVHSFLKWDSHRGVYVRFDLDPTKVV